MAEERHGRATFVGIGAQKTASTWLYGVLAQLPGVAVSDRKEVDFFSAFFDRGYEWYERHFAAAAAAERGEVSPSYFIGSDVPARVMAYNPAMKIIVTLRDPVDRAFSNHLHEVRKGHVSGPNRVFETALANNPLYVEQGRYARHLERWLEHVPRAQVLVLFQEAIRADGAAAARTVADFLGVAPVRTLDRAANESVAYRNRLVGEAFWRMGRAARRSGLGGTVEAVKRWPVVRELRAANRKAIRDEVAPMRPQTEAWLTDLYASDVARLEALVGGTPPWPRFGTDALSRPARPPDAELVKS